MTAPGTSGIWAWRSARCAVCEPGCHEGERSGLAGHPRRGLRGRGPVLRRDPGSRGGLRCGEHYGTGGWERRQDPAIRPGHRYFEFCRSHGASIVGLLEVDDLDQASAELARGGAELLGEPESDGTWTWLTFRAPDGNIHSLGARMA